MFFYIFENLLKFLLKSIYFVSYGYKNDAYVNSSNFDIWTYNS